MLPNWGELDWEDEGAPKLKWWEGKNPYCRQTLKAQGKIKTQYPAFKSILTSKVKNIEGQLNCVMCGKPRGYKGEAPKAKKQKKAKRSRNNSKVIPGSENEDGSEAGSRPNSPDENGRASLDPDAHTSEAQVETPVLRMDVRNMVAHLSEFFKSNDEIRQQFHVDREGNPDGALDKLASQWHKTIEADEFSDLRGVYGTAIELKNIMRQSRDEAVTTAVRISASASAFAAASAFIVERVLEAAQEVINDESTKRGRQNAIAKELKDSERYFHSCLLHATEVMAESTHGPRKHRLLASLCSCRWSRRIFNDRYEAIRIWLTKTNGGAWARTQHFFKLVGLLLYCCLLVSPLLAYVLSGDSTGKHSKSDFWTGGMNDAFFEIGGPIGLLLLVIMTFILEQQFGEATQRARRERFECEALLEHTIITVVHIGETDVGHSRTPLLLRHVKERVDGECAKGSYSSVRVMVITEIRKLVDKETFFATIFADDVTPEALAKLRSVREAAQQLLDAKPTGICSSLFGCCRSKKATQEWFCSSLTAGSSQLVAQSW